MPTRMLHASPRSGLWLTLFALVASPPALPQEVEWIRQYESAPGDDASGVYMPELGPVVAGTISRALPGQVHQGGADVFVRRHGAGGQELWTHQFGTDQYEYLNRLLCDGEDDIYVLGSTYGTFPGQTGGGHSDVFLYCLGADGAPRWVRQLGTPLQELPGGIGLDASGIYITGFTRGTLPGQPAHDGDYMDTFVRKYRRDGTEMWTRQSGTSFDDWSTALSVTSSGIYVVGNTSGAFPGQPWVLGFGDGFCRKFDRDGREIWTRQLGTDGFDFATAAAADDTGVYIAGATRGTFPGEPSGGDEFGDAFLARYDPNGSLLWVRQVATREADQADAVWLDATGVLVGGWTQGSFPGHPDVDETEKDAFARKFDRDGSLLWTTQIGTAGGEFLLEIAGGIEAGCYYLRLSTDGAFPGATPPAMGERNQVLVKLAPPCGEGTRFRRGDSSGDGVLNIGDAIHLLRSLFLGDATISCEKASDANDSGGLDISDPVYLLGFLFLGGPAPPWPFSGEPGQPVPPQTLGLDSTPDELDCCRYPRE